MAARLNIPADFSLPKRPGLAVGKASDELLPPSSFEVPSIGDPWKSLASATSEIIQLKAENQRLKDTKEIRLPAGEEIKARIDVHQGSPVMQLPTPVTSSHRELSHFDDILNRQAAEIDSLRKKMYSQEADSQKTIAKLESQLAVQNAQKEQQSISLATELEHFKKNHKDEILHLMEEHRKHTSELSQQLEAAKEMHLSCSEQYNCEIRSQWEKLEKTQEELKSTLESIDTKLREKDATIQQQKEHIQQLKQYMSSSESMAKSTAVWKQEVDSLNHKIKDLENDHTVVCEQLKLLEIRLQSQTRILEAQEQTLSQGKEECSDKIRLSLLTRWREKVFELLVQMKSEELSHKQERHQLKLQVANAERDLKTSKNETNVLQNTLADYEAQLQLEKNKVMSLQVALTDAQEMALSLDDQLKENVTSIVQLAQMAYSLHREKDYLDNRLKETLPKLKAYDQRIAFASGRVEMLQGQFARKEAMMKLNLQAELDNKPTRDREEELEAEPQITQYVKLEEELARVTDERDRLVSQMKKDAQTLQMRLSDARNQYADEVVQLQNRLTDVHTALDEKSDKCTGLSKSVEEAHMELAEARDTMERLNRDLARQQLEAEKAADEMRSADQTQHVEQLAEMERQLNAARREHTKAVVSLRQTERQVVRDKQRLQEQLRVAEETQKQMQDQFHTRLRTVEKDRNLLMATLRQEGLIGKYQSQRPTPAISSLDEGDADRKTQTSEPLFETETTTITEEPLHTVIDDLKSLTVAVMEDDNRGSSGTEES